MEKAIARQIYEAGTKKEIEEAEKRLEEHVKKREEEGMEPKQVRAAIKAWITRLKRE